MWPLMENFIFFALMSAEKLFKWFKQILMKCNTYKCHLILLIVGVGDSNQIQSEHLLINPLNASVALI